MASESKDPVKRAALLFILAASLSACVEGQKDGPDGGVDNTFTLKGTVKVLPNPNLVCTSSDKKKDCKGNVYWGVFDRPMTNFTANPPLRAGTLKDAKHGSTFTATGIPVKAQLYIGAFMDDNSDMVRTAPVPDTGDPVFYSLGSFSVSAGQTHNASIDFLVRLW